MAAALSAVLGGWPIVALARAGGGQTSSSGGGGSSGGGSIGAMGTFSSFGECFCYFLAVIVGLAVLAWWLGRGTNKDAGGAGSAEPPPEDGEPASTVDGSPGEDAGDPDSSADDRQDQTADLYVKRSNSARHRSE